MFYIESLIFLLSSSLVFTVSYYKIISTTLSQFIALFLLLFIVVFGKTIYARPKLSQNKYFRLLILFLVAVFAQLVVISTGGFYSPFLILVHLFTLGASIVLNSYSAISFLVLSVTLLLLNTFINPQLFSLFREDPGPILLYTVSFAVIIPLAHLLMSNYHLKDRLFEILRAYAQLGEQREESILRSLKELIIVTDKNLKIISVNEAVEEALQLSTPEIISRPLFDIIPLKNKNGSPIDPKSLAINEIITDKASRIINGLYFFSKKSAHLTKTIVQIRPIINSEGQINQIVFIIDEPVKDFEGHADLEQAYTKHKLLVEDLKRTLFKANSTKLVGEMEFISQTEDDLLTALEIEDHSIKETKTPEDIALISNHAVATRQEFGQAVGVTLKFTLPQEENKEEIMIDLTKSNLPSAALPISTFTVPTNRRWVKTAIEKLLDIAILLTSEKRGSTVTLTPKHINDTTINIVITAPYHELSKKEQEDLFAQYYGALGIKTNLRLGSGLEGFIAKTIISQLNIPLKVESLKNPQCLVFTLTFATFHPVAS